MQVKSSALSDHLHVIADNLRRNWCQTALNCRKGRFIANHLPVASDNRPLNARRTHADALQGASAAPTSAPEFQQNPCA
jgi:hypothetical protein